MAQGSPDALAAQDIEFPEIDYTPYHIEYLSEEDYKTLLMYRHYAPKTMIEVFMIDNVTCHIESALPNSWSANTFTVLGNIPLYFAGITALVVGGTKYNIEMPSWVYYLAAVAVTTFSWFDIMDGQRARRLKCGTPIGRIIDEAGDAFQYTWVAFIVGYIVQVPPGWLCLSFGLINLPQYSFEMKFVLSGDLQITSGNFDVGPIEMEMIYTIIFLLAAIFGTTGIEKSIDLYFVSVQFNQLVCCFFIFLLVFFSFDALKESVALNVPLTLRMLATPLFILGQAILAAYIGVYTFEKSFALFHLMYSFTFNIGIYRLMISNMTNKAASFMPVHIENVIAALPLAAHLLAKNQIEKDFIEPLMTLIAVCSLILLYWVYILLLSGQYLAR